MAAGNFIGHRWLVSGGFTGSYGWQAVLLEPSARVFALWEHENAYTDSLDDAPLLGAATKRGFLVNARPGVVAKLAGQSHIAQLRWT